MTGILHSFRAASTKCSLSSEKCYSMFSLSCHTAAVCAVLSLLLPVVNWGQLDQYCTPTTPGQHSGRKIMEKYQGDSV